MKENKYFTPTITDLCIDFEYEILENSKMVQKNGVFKKL